MNSDPNKLTPYFDPETRFEVEPTAAERLYLEETFSDLKGGLLGAVLDGTECITLVPALKQAANEAAGLAWTTSYPLLVFPTLFAEFTQKARLHDSRQRSIFARSEMLSTAEV